MKTERISGRDDLAYDVEIHDAMGAPVTTGSVTMMLCQLGTATPLVNGTAAQVALEHQGAGRWTGTHDDADVATAIAAVPLRALFDRVCVVEGRGARRVARCQRVPVLSGS